VDNEWHFFGNEPGRTGCEVDTWESENPTTRHPLVEETVKIHLSDMRRLHGRRVLLRAAEEGRPIGVQINRNAFPIYLLAEPMRLPRRNRRVPDTHAIRLWLVCFGCHRRARILYSLPKFPGSPVMLMPMWPKLPLPRLHEPTLRRKPVVARDCDADEAAGTAAPTAPCQEAKRENRGAGGPPGPVHQPASSAWDIEDPLNAPRCRR